MDRLTIPHDHRQITYMTAVLVLGLALAMMLIVLLARAI